MSRRPKLPNDRQVQWCDATAAAMKNIAGAIKILPVLLRPMTQEKLTDLRSRLSGIRRFL